MGSFEKNNVSVSPPLLSQESISYLEERQMLVWLGESRDSYLHADHTKLSIKRSSEHFMETVKLLKSTTLQIENSNLPKDVFEALKMSVAQGWQLKKEFTSKLHPALIEIEKIARDLPEVSMKLCGAGGSGFILFLAEPQTLKDMQSLLPDRKAIFPKIELSGATQISLECDR